MENTIKNRTLIIGVIISILALYFLPLVGNAVDLTPPEIENIWVNCPPGVPRNVVLHQEVAGNLSITCDVMETTGLPENVNIVITGPNNLMTNITMPIDPTTDQIPPYSYYLYIFNSSLNLGSYHFYIWAKDTAGNQNQSENYYFVIIENRMDYVHINASNTNGPWDGTAQHPLKTIGDGLDAVNPNGMVFVHNGIYDKIFPYSDKKIDQSVFIQGESKEHTIIDGGFSSITDYIMKLSGTQNTNLMNLTLQNGLDFGIILDSTSNKRITNCIIRNNPTGILFGASDDNIITNCTIQNNTNGITFYGNTESNNNQIYHNNFIGNTHKTIGVFGTETWDNGRTGNYWDNYRTVHPTATINTTTGTWNTPLTIDSHNIDHHPWVNPDGSFNRPPEIPTTPTGQTVGYVNSSYTYTTNTVSDPDGDPVFYLFDWGDGTTTNWMVTPTASHQWTTPGEYQVKVKAKDSHDSETDWPSSLPVQITTQTIPENQLQINAPASITEGTTFTITVTVNGANLENAAVTFAGSTRDTNAVGQTSFTAPHVQQNTQYPLSAQHTGYTPATITIVVLHHEQQLGYIYGIVRDSTLNSPVQIATITVYLSNQENKITFTDTDGRYNILVPIGTYTVETSKPGYLTQTKQNIVVLVNSAIEQNFLLEKTQTTSSENTDHQSSVIEYTIQEKASQGTIGARINLQPTEKTVSYYSPHYTINLQPTNTTNISFTISADDNTTATIIVVRIGPGVLSDLDNITLTYDGRPLNETVNLETFFTSTDNVTPSWFGVLTRTGLYAFIRIPHFSTHTITISSELIKALVNPTALIIYTVAFVFVAALYIVPIVVVQKKK